MQSKTVQLRTSPPKKLLPAKQPTIFRLFHQPPTVLERFRSALKLRQIAFDFEHHMFSWREY